MNKLDRSPIFDLPNELYPPMMGLPSGNDNISWKETSSGLQIAYEFSKTSKDSYKKIFAILSRHPIFKSLFSQNPNDLVFSETSSPLRPLVRYIEFLKDIYRNTLSWRQIRVAGGKSFFEIIDEIHKAVLDHMPSAIRRSNLVMYVPKFLFTTRLQRFFSPERVEHCMEMYKSGGGTVSVDYPLGVCNLMQAMEPLSLEERRKRIECIVGVEKSIQLLEVMSKGDLQYAEVELAYREFIDEVIGLERFRDVMKSAPEWLKSDVNFMTKAVYHDGDYISKASLKVLSKRDLVKIAIVQSGAVLFSLPSSCLLDEEYVLLALQHNGALLGGFDDRFKSDKRFVLPAVKNYGLALKYAAEDLQKDHQIVLSSVKMAGTALEYASEDLRDDAGIVLEAVKNNPCAYYYASSRLQHDRGIILEMVKNDGIMLYNVPSELKKDREIVLTAVKNNKQALRFAAEEFRKDPEIGQYQL